jgi:hypothetical protein
MSCPLITNATNGRTRPILAKSGCDEGAHEKIFSNKSKEFLAIAGNPIIVTEKMVYNKRQHRKRSFPLSSDADIYLAIIRKYEILCHTDLSKVTDVSVFKDTAGEGWTIYAIQSKEIFREKENCITGLCLGYSFSDYKVDKILREIRQRSKMA